MPPPDGPLRDWWPATQSMDLVEADISAAAEAVHRHYTRFDPQAVASLDWLSCENLGEALVQLDPFDNVATRMLLLPTRSRWTVMVCNSFLCDGFDSLCDCLTRFDGLTSIHWAAHDDWTTFQSGALFHYRQRVGEDVMERRVQTAQQDKSWHWSAEGDALAEEDIESYSARKRRDRLNEERVISLLDRLGARPWDNESYAIPGKVAIVSRSVPAPATVRPASAVLRS